MKTYLELYPESMEGNGLIRTITEQGAPWTPMEEQTITTLEQLFAVHSGFKTVTPAFVVADEASRARMLLLLYKEKWARLWNDFKLEYNPLDAYRVDETITRDKDTTNEDKTNYGKTSKTDSTDGGTVGTTESDTRAVLSGVYGFNTAGVSVPSDVSDDSGSANSTETRNLESSSTTANSGTDTTSTTSTEDETTVTKRSGNIGYTTPQELIRQDLEVWQTPYFNLVFEDIDNFIMLQVYSM